MQNQLFSVSPLSFVTYKADSVCKTWWHVSPFMFHYCKNEKLLNIKYKITLQM